MNSDIQFHHVAILTADLESSIRWYKEFYGCDVSWTLSTFSSLTERRIPGITSLAELTVCGIRFHIFTRGPEYNAPTPLEVNQFHHICLAVPSLEELRSWRERWLAISDAGIYSYVRQDQATEIVIDSEGVHSFYAHDINGVEYEFTFEPAPSPATA